MRSSSAFVLVLALLASACGGGSAASQQPGQAAVIHATGTTDDGVGIDATVNCPSVLRQ